MEEMELASRSPDSFDDILPNDVARDFARTLSEARLALEGRTLWEVNSTATGGGVAEMLQSVLCYPLGAGIPIRWLVIDGNDEFFEVTKRIHHFLHGSRGDGRALGERERRVYETALEQDAQRLAEMVKPGDPVILHDPQTLGLVPLLSAAGARLVWQCHVGADKPNELTRQAWRFLMPYVQQTHAQVFTRTQYIWDGLDRSHTALIPPCLDVLSPKNQELDEGVVAAILAACGVLPSSAAGRPEFVRQDGTPARVSGQAEMIEEEPVPAGVPLVGQISRWDPLKDHVGVMIGFCQHVPEALGAHLLLAGPAPESVSDDPEGRRTFDKLRDAWRQLPAPVRRRVHLVLGDSQHDDQGMTSVVDGEDDREAGRGGPPLVVCDANVHT